MKISLYTFLFINKNKAFVYNSLSNSLLEIDNDSFNILKNVQKHNIEITENDIDNDLYKILKDRRFLTENQLLICSTLWTSNIVNGELIVAVTHGS